MVIKKFEKQILESCFNLIDPKNKYKVILGSGITEICHDFYFLKKKKYFWNSFETINSLKDVNTFFNKMKLLNVSVPRWSTKKSFNDKYLRKKTISFGGNFVTKNRKKPKNIFLKKDKFSYYQEFIEGETVSIQFYAEKSFFKVLSLCSQWIEGNNFLLGGMKLKKMNTFLENRVITIARRVSKCLNLVGLNSIDFIITKTTNIPELIEINPRPGLSCFLLDKIHGENLYKKKSNGSIENKGYFTTIVYSQHNFKVEKKVLHKFNETDQIKFSELPTLNSFIKKGEPICLMHQMVNSKDTTSMNQKIRSIFKK